MLWQARRRGAAEAATEGAWLVSLRSFAKRGVGISCTWRLLLCRSVLVLTGCLLRYYKVRAEKGSTEEPPARSPFPGRLGGCR